MKVAVVVTTYNGSRFLREQLDSIRDQNFPVDEVLILDDKSTDGTPALVSDYIKANELRSWRLIENKEQLGWRVNFITGFDVTNCDIIFPCDQDDIWHLDKISSMVNIMSEHPEIDVLESNYKPFFLDNAERFDRSYKTDNTLTKIELSKHNIYNLRPGCSLCFRKSFFNTVYPVLWDKDMAHDEFLWKTAMLKGTLYIYNRITINYRRHANNATVRVPPSLTSRLEDIICCKKFFKACVEFDGFGLKARGLANKEFDFYSKREAFFSSPSIGKLFGMLPFLTYYKTFRNMIGDLAYYFNPSCLRP